MTYWCEFLMFFPGPLTVLIKMLMALYCACIYFDHHNAEEKSIKLKCCFCRREGYLLSCSTKDRSGLPAKHWLHILNSRYCTYSWPLSGRSSGPVIFTWCYSHWTLPRWIQTQASSLASQREISLLSQGSAILMYSQVHTASLFPKALQKMMVQLLASRFGLSF